jgi:hypothetical protein
VVPLAHTGGGGSDFGRTIQLPNDPLLQGFVINAQVLILGDDAKSYLSNGVTRVIGE